MKMSVILLEWERVSNFHFISLKSNNAFACSGNRRKLNWIHLFISTSQKIYITSNTYLKGMVSSPYVCGRWSLLLASLCLTHRHDWLFLSNGKFKVCMLKIEMNFWQAWIWEQNSNCSMNRKRQQPIFSFLFFSFVLFICNFLINHILNRRADICQIKGIHECLVSPNRIFPSTLLQYLLEEFRRLQYKIHSRIQVL